MRIRILSLLPLFLPAIITTQLIMPSALHYSLLATQQSSNLKLLGPNGEANPVVNQGGQIKLKVADPNGQPVTDVTFTSGSTDVATIDQMTGMVTGVERGFTTITARRSD